MADIAYGEKIKKIFRMLLRTGLKFIGSDLQMVKDDLLHNQNPVVRQLNTLLLIMGKHLEERPWQRQAAEDYSQALLWLAVKDTAYRDPFFWTINEVLEHAEEFKKIIKPYVKPPKEWLANQWEDSMKETEKLKKEGKIPEHGKSLRETFFTPAIQNMRHQKMFEQFKKKKNRK